ncbi:Alpha-L-fucosidase [Handroanthus impetiginosus]|uniref:Alpha-L-fucosidase n=1 Tax=Handroanthus impetiginosus TaxID=429701 RepID=A0A2G9G8F0_9LAMI|nr:Alpha-L-fucosidase [Handroanthus impetiginosus]
MNNVTFEAIFNFGDSNSDTGGFYAAFPSQPSPNGLTYFGRPTAQALGLPFLSPYLQSIGSDYRHGVNFATSASPALRPNTSLFVTGISPFYLAVQVNQMKAFKSRVEEFKSQEYLFSGNTNLPQPDILGKALYTIYTGQWDIAHDVAYLEGIGTRPFEPQIASEIVNAVKELYSSGGRAFLVFNLAPVGCYAAVLTLFSHDESDIDPLGCMSSFNNAVREYNSLYQNPTSQGLQQGITACCGYGGGSYNFDPRVFCRISTEINGQRVTATACSDPQNYVSWDGIHLTENANKIMAYAVLSGSYFDPHFSLNEYCDFNLF